MKSMILGAIAAATLSIGAAAAQSTADPAAKTTAPAPSAAASAPGGAFIERQQDGLLRAPKIVGVAVYDSNNKNVGKIDDLLIDHDGSVKAVVIGIGGFLGIGSKDVAIPYSAVHWQTEQRTVAVNEAPPANPVGSTTAPGEKTKTQTIPSAKTEAYNGYPDRAVIDMTQEQLKAAPQFKYASDPAAMNAPGDATASPAQKP